jgi:uncharacterized membrane protein YjjP (DUF1212 family)
MEASSATHEVSPIRFWLGMLQMAGAAFSFALLWFTGLSVATIVATTATTAVAGTSLLSQRTTAKHVLADRDADKRQRI